MLKKITEGDLANKGVIGLPDTPGYTTAEMQRKFEETAREVIIPFFNQLVDSLMNAEGDSGAANVGAFGQDGRPTTVQAHILDKNNPHGITAAAIGAISEAETKKLIADAVFQSGGGDMYKAVYDPTGKATDIFAYTDNAIREAITSALNGEV